MRLWSLHPRHLDGPGLVALWREALLAQAVLAGRTSGYRHHPQLTRFRDARDPLGGLAAYLDAVAAEAASRDYAFDTGRIDAVDRAHDLIDVTVGQLELERQHLAAKLARRRPGELDRVAGPVRPHPLFRVVPGDPEPWERAEAPGRR